MGLWVFEEKATEQKAGKNKGTKSVCAAFFLETTERAGRTKIVHRHLKSVIEILPLTRSTSSERSPLPPSEN
ncbi:hypothetical protein RUM43_007112, partial [Polyplax serrata]